MSAALLLKVDDIYQQSKKANNMKITAADVGRQVVLRNGQKDTVKEISNGFVRLVNYPSAYYISGCLNLFTENNFDIVGFADEPVRYAESTPAPSAEALSFNGKEGSMPSIKIPTKTLRDEFAMAALTGMINYMANMKVKTGGLGYEVTINVPEVAIASYEYADAMMAAREGKTNAK